MIRRLLPVFLLLAVRTDLAAASASSTNDPVPLISKVLPSMVRVEVDLQFDKGEPPTGVLDQDPGGGSQRIHTLAQVVEEERPLESTGYLVAPDEVVDMDSGIHPRFIKEIRVVSRSGSTRAEISGYSVDHWAVRLKLKNPLPDTKPLVFGEGKPAFTFSYYRMDGAMITDVVPYSSHIQRADGGMAQRILEQGGLAVTTDGTPVAMLFSRRVAAEDNSWMGSPAKWRFVDVPSLDTSLKNLATDTSTQFPRVRLSFRSPKNTPASNARMRGDRDEDGEGEATERDVLGMILPGNRVLVLASLKSPATARLQRITVYGPDGASVNARFVASLKDFGGLVADLEKPFGTPPVLTSISPYDLVGKLGLRADLNLQGETRSDHFHTVRISSFRVGARTEPYPELVDMSDSWHAYLYDLDRRLVALPIARKSFNREDRHSAVPQLTFARLVLDAVAKLPSTADPANVPVSEADENRLAWLGTELQPLTRELARANGVADQTRDGASGALVTYVHPESPAAQAGIVAGNVLVRVRTADRPLPIEVDLDESEMRNAPFPWDRLDDIREQFFDRIPTPWPPAENSFTRALTDLGFGTRYTAELVIDGKLVNKEFSVAQGPVHYESAARFKSDALGLTVRDLTYDVRRYLQRKIDEPGVVVGKVETGGKASVAGVKPYEVITHVNEQPVRSSADFDKAVAGGGELKLSIKRMAKGRIVTIKAK